MFNLNEVTSTSDVLAPGEYAACVTGIEKKATKSGTGEYYQIELTVTTKGANGRKIWDIFNTKNDNADTVNIALSKMKQLAVAAGFTEDKLAKFHPEMLATKEVKITTTIKKDETYGDKAAVKKYAALTGNTNVPNESESIPF